MDDIVGTPDWSQIPPPVDDGGTVDLSICRGRTVVYIYPRTGRPGVPNPGGWDMIPGARGCSPQSCAFRDHFVELKRLGVDRLYGLSTQDTAYQREAADRLHLPFPLRVRAANRAIPARSMAPYGPRNKSPEARRSRLGNPPLRQMVRAIVEHVATLTQAAQVA